MSYEYPCSLCSKGFRSNKALSGHMRVHSPSIINQSHVSSEEKCQRKFLPNFRSDPIVSNNNNSSSTVSHVIKTNNDIGEEEEQQDVNVVDLEQVLRGYVGWGAKAIRGRFALTVNKAAEKEAVGVQNPILPPPSGVQYSDQLPAGSGGVRDNTKLESKTRDSEETKNTKRKNSQVLTDEEASGLAHSNKKFKVLSNDCDHKGSLEDEEHAKKQMQKVTKYYMVNDFKAALSDHDSVIPHSSSATMTTKKLLTDHQDINKEMVISNNVTAAQGRGQGYETGSSHKHVSASSNVLLTHQCNVCFKIYPSGMALEAHKGLHCSSVLSKTPPHQLLPSTLQPGFFTAEPVGSAIAPRVGVSVQEPEEAPHAPDAPIQDSSDNNGDFSVDFNELPPAFNDREAAIVQPAEQTEQEASSLSTLSSSA